VLGQKKTITIDHHVEDMDLVFYTVDAENNENKIMIGKVRGVEKGKHKLNLIPKATNLIFMINY
jgi:hypothetical protein